MTWVNGDKYTGDWVKGKKHGHAVVNYIKGDVLTVEFKYNCMHGKGELIYPTGQKFEGTWIKNKREGQGRITDRDGSYIIAEWKNNDPHGCGICYYSNGDA